MKLTDKACKKHDLSFAEGIALIAIASSEDSVYDNLVAKGLISKVNGSLQSLNKKYHASELGVGLANELLADSEVVVEALSTQIDELADKLREIYPGGRIPGTAYYYKGNKSDIVRKLKSFIARYGSKVTFEQIIDATKRYVESFNGNYRYLKLLKYFIWQDERRDGETLRNSILMDFIENKEQDNHNNSDWMTTMV